jgi:PAS domain S-box-containing protein
MPASASRPAPKASADLTFDPAGIVAAVDRSLAVIELELDGTVVTANQNFLDVMGYALEGIQGQHHRLFCPPGHADSAEYAELWACLAAGESVQDVFHRVGQGGREVWPQATYNPILDAKGAPMKVVKFATDVTATKLEGAEIKARVDAVDRAQAVLHDGVTELERRRAKRQPA